MRFSYKTDAIPNGDYSNQRKLTKQFPLTRVPGEDQSSQTRYTQLANLATNTSQMHKVVDHHYVKQQIRRMRSSGAAVPRKAALKK